MTAGGGLEFGVSDSGDGVSCLGARDPDVGWSFSWIFVRESCSVSASMSEGNGVLRDGSCGILLTVLLVQESTE